MAACPQKLISLLKAVNRANASLSSLPHIDGVVTLFCKDIELLSSVNKFTFCCRRLGEICLSYIETELKACLELIESTHSPILSQSEGGLF